MIIIKLLIIQLLLLITFFNKVINKQYYLFNWYCKRYYNLKESLTKNEIKYIYNIFNLSPIELFNKTMDGKRLSFVTYSHELKDNNKLFSGKFAIGSIVFPHLSFHYALEILNERKIVLPRFLFNNNKYIFGGLGWDFHKKIFKIYFRAISSTFIKDKESVNIIKNIKDKRINKILKDFNTNKYWKEGLISFSYKKNKLYEKKLYLYPKYSYKNLTYMLSTKRGIIIQKDVFNKNINNSIIEDYNKINFELDTYSKTKNGIIMYFPK